MPAHVVINDVLPSIQYLADGVQSAFIFPFAVFKAGDLQVWADAERLLSGFTLSGVGDSSGGTVQFAAPPAAGIRLTLRRRLTLERRTDFQTDGIIRSKTLNDELDYQVAAVQQVAEEVGRAIRRSPTSGNAADLTLPEPESGRALKWSADGLALVNSDRDLDQSLSQAMAMAASSSESAAASEMSRQAAELAEVNALASAAAAAQSEAQVAEVLVNAPRKDNNLSDLADREAASANLRVRRPEGGAVARALADKVAEAAVSVLDFGAVADNATDNTLAFQRAMDAIHAAGGGTVLVPYAGNGQYLFRRQPTAHGQPNIRVYSNTEIVIAAGVRLRSQAVFAGHDSALLTAAAGARNIAIRGPGGFKAADGIPVTGTTTAGSTAVTGIAATAGLLVHMPVHGPGLAEGTSITAVGANGITLSAAATASATVTLTAHYTGSPFLSMLGVAGLVVDGVALMDVYGATEDYAVRTLFAATNFHLTNIRVGYEDRVGGTGRAYSGEDGIHVLAPSSKGVIANITGTSGDDFIALNVEPFQRSSGWDAELSDIQVTNCVGQSNWGNVVHVYIYENAVNGTIKRINISNVSGKAAALTGDAVTCGLCIEDRSQRSFRAISNVNVKNTAWDCSTQSNVGLYVTRAEDVVIDGVSTQSPYNEDIFVTSCDRVTVANAHIVTPGRNPSKTGGIRFMGCSGVNVLGAVVRNKLAHAIRLDDTTVGSVAFVNADNNVGYGVLLNNTKDVKVIGSTFSRHASYAVCEVGSSNCNIISMNDMTKNTNGGVFTLGANSIVSNNI